MNRNPQIESWRRFREAEAAGRDAEADAALRELFAALPRLSPAPGFAGRVLARVRTPSLFARPAVRFGLAAALLVAALGAALVAPMVLPIAGLVGPGSILSLAIRGLAAASVRAASGFAAWGALAGALETLGRAMLHPSVLVLVLAQFALAALALRGLRALAPSTRSARHAS